MTSSADEFRVSSDTLLECSSYFCVVCALTLALGPDVPFFCASFFCRSRAFRSGRDSFFTSVEKRDVVVDEEPIEAPNG